MSNLSKNIISKDGPTNDLERLVSNMSGSEYPVEPTFGLGKEIKKIDKDGSSSSGGDLPTPTQADAGKAVVVNNIGEYVLNNVGGVTVVTFENTVDLPDVYTANMTLEEMNAAQPTGLIGIRLRHTSRDGDQYYQMTPYKNLSYFTSVIYNDGSILAQYLTYNEETAKWDYSDVNHPLTPST